MFSFNHKIFYDGNLSHKKSETLLLLASSPEYLFQQVRSDSFRHIIKSTVQMSAPEGTERKKESRVITCSDMEL